MDKISKISRVKKGRDKLKYWDIMKKKIGVH